MKGEGPQLRIALPGPPSAAAGPPEMRLGLGPDLEHSEASILLELQSSPFWGIRVSAGFAVASELFNFT